MKEYKKLFDIEINSKIFTIFIDNRRRCTFLEKNKSGEYVYPELSDFLLLHNAFNIRVPYILNTIQKYTFSEKVRYSATALLMVAVMALSYKPSDANYNTNYDTKVEGNSLVITEVELPSYIEINTFSDLDSLGLENLSLEDIHKAIDANTKTPLEYKVLSHMIANELFYKYPEADLSVFYLNALDLNVNDISSEDLQQSTKQAGVGANFDSRTSTINASADCDTGTKAHELGHSVTALYKYINDVLFVKNCYFGYSLEEAMNNKIVALITAHDSYEKQGAVLDYFCTCVPFTITDYVNNNISYLISMLKEKYPEVDIDYLVSTLDAMMDTRINFGIEVPLDANISFLDEIFLICKKNVQTSTNCYASFTEFAKLLDYANDKELFYKYLEEYNEYLKTLGVTDIVTKDDVVNKWNELQNVCGFAFDNDGFYPMINVGNEGLVPRTLKDGQLISAFDGQTSINNRGISYLFYSIPEYYSVMDSEEYWKDMAINSGVVKKKDLEPLEFCLNGNLVFKEYIRNINMQIGVTDTGEIGYIIRNVKGDILYISSSNLKNLSATLPIKFYLGANRDIDKVELSTYLNESYLKLFVLEHGQLLSNVSVQDEQIQIDPMYVISIVTDDGVMRVGIQNINVEINSDNQAILSPLYIKLNAEVTDVVNLKYILKYYNILNPEVSEYSFTQDELVKMVEDYLNKDINKAR